jgi:hypothetical protein
MEAENSIKAARKRKNRNRQDSRYRVRYNGEVGTPAKSTSVEMARE